jgi:hypothetical protein
MLFFFYYVVYSWEIVYMCFVVGKIWPPRTPDLTSQDFFLWSYLKDTVYWSNLRDLKQLKMNITRAIEEVNEGTLRKVARNMVKCVNKCIEMNGHHFPHLL